MSHSSQVIVQPIPARLDECVCPAHQRLISLPHLPPRGWPAYGRRGSHFTVGAHGLSARQMMWSRILQEHHAELSHATSQLFHALGVHQRDNC
jgi:hypothetical protein